MSKETAGMFEDSNDHKSSPIKVSFFSLFFPLSCCFSSISPFLLLVHVYKGVTHQTHFGFGCSDSVSPLCGINRIPSPFRRLHRHSLLLKLACGWFDVSEIQCKVMALNHGFLLWPDVIVHKCQWEIVCHF